MTQIHRKISAWHRERGRKVVKMHEVELNLTLPTFALAIVIEKLNF